MVTVYAPFDPGLTDNVEGDAEIVKSGCAALTVTATVVECVSDPLVPVIVSMKLPVLVAEVVEMASVEFAVGVSGVGSEHVAPGGQPVTVKSTLLLNPFRAVAVTVEAPDAPWVSVTDEGEAETEKSD